MNFREEMNAILSCWNYYNIINRRKESTVYKFAEFDGYKITVLGTITPRSGKVGLYPSFFSLHPELIANSNYLDVLTIINKDSKIYYVDKEHFSDMTPEKIQEERDLEVKSIDSFVLGYNPNCDICMDIHKVGDKLASIIGNQSRVVIKVGIFSGKDAEYELVKSQEDLDTLDLDDRFYFFRFNNLEKEKKGNYSIWTTILFSEIFDELIKNGKAYYIVGQASNRSTSHAFCLTLELSEKDVLIEVVDSNGNTLNPGTLIWIKHLMVYIDMKGFNVEWNTTFDDIYKPQEISDYYELKNHATTVKGEEGYCIIYSLYYLWLRIINPSLTGKRIRNHIMKTHVYFLRNSIKKLNSYVLDCDDEIL